MEKGVDVLIATLDWLQKNRDKEKVFVSNVQTLVLDEFDTMLDGGYEKELGDLIAQV